MLCTLSLLFPAYAAFNMLCIYPTAAVHLSGGIDPKHAAAYAAFGGWIRSCYGTPLASTSMPKGDWSVQVPFTQGATNFDRVMMGEE